MTRKSPGIGLARAVHYRALFLKLCLNEETTEMRTRDLTEIINHRRSRTYLSRALSVHWNAWGQYERDDAEARNPRLRRLAKQERVERLGMRLPL